MIDAKSVPAAGERWLSRPPYVLIAHIVRVDRSCTPPTVTYELQDDDGSLLERVERAALDPSWWKVFQPMTRYRG